jgi:hypothetical protein
VASSRKASAAPGDIGAKSAPMSRSQGTPAAQPHSAIAPSAATAPKAAYAMRVSRNRIFGIEASLTPLRAAEYRPNSYGRTMSGRADVEVFRLWYFFKSDCASSAGEPYWARINHIAAVVTKPAKPVAFAALV